MRLGSTDTERPVTGDNGDEGARGQGRERASRDSGLGSATGTLEHTAVTRSVHLPGGASGTACWTCSHLSIAGDVLTFPDGAPE